jgi:acyl-CoA thioester hydrolase
MSELAEAPVAAPLLAEGMVVQPEWIDSNGHMNIAYYMMVFDDAFGQVYRDFGYREDELTTWNASNFVAEMHITYQRELHAGDPLRVTTQLLGFNEKRCNFIQHLYHAGEGFLAATNEWLIAYVDMTTRRSAVMPALQQQRLARVLAAHRHLPVPSEAGRAIRLSPRSPA